MAECSYVALQSGQAEAALQLLSDGLQRYPADTTLQVARGWYDYYTGKSDLALVRFRVVAPGLFRDPPEIHFGIPYEYAVEAAYVARQSGDVPRAESIAKAFLSFTDSTREPALKVLPEIGLARMQAVMGGHAAVVEHLSNVYQSGAAIWASVHQQVRWPALA